MYIELSKKQIYCVYKYLRRPMPDLPVRFQLHDLSLYHPCTHLQAIPSLKTRGLMKYYQHSQSKHLSHYVAIMMTFRHNVVLIEINSGRIRVKDLNAQCACHDSFQKALTKDSKTLHSSAAAPLPPYGTFYNLL